MFRVVQQTQIFPLKNEPGRYGNTNNNNNNNKTEMDHSPICKATDMTRPEEHHSSHNGGKNKQTNKHCAVEHEDKAKTSLLFELKVITHLILRFPRITVPEKRGCLNIIIKLMLPAFNLFTLLANFSDGTHRYVHRVVIWNLEKKMFYLLVL